MFLLWLAITLSGALVVWRTRLLAARFHVDEYAPAATHRHPSDPTRRRSLILSLSLDALAFFSLYFQKHSAASKNVVRTV